MRTGFLLKLDVPDEGMLGGRPCVKRIDMDVEGDFADAVKELARKVSSVYARHEPIEDVLIGPGERGEATVYVLKDGWVKRIGSVKEWLI